MSDIHSIGPAVSLTAEWHSPIVGAGSYHQDHDFGALGMSADYTARHISVLEGLDAVRKRPAMYIGSTDSRGLMHCLWEVIDNSVDEALAGHGERIDITLHEDGSVEVADQGRGIPVDEVAGQGLSGVEVVYTKLHAGGKFGGSMYAAAGGLHGVGASVVNALSARLDVEVDRGGKTYAMSFRRGEPGIFDDSEGRGPDSPFAPFIKASELRVVAAVPKRRTGTRVRYWSDRQIFPATAVFDSEELVRRARQTAFLIPGLELRLEDHRTGPSQTHSFRHDGGLVDFANFLAADEPVNDVWHLKGGGKFTETVQTIGKDGHLHPAEVEREVEVEVALRWGTGYDTVVRSFVNIIATPKGGTHVAGFEQGLLKVLRKQIEANARRLKVSLKDGKERLEKDDALAGVVAVVAVRVPEPEFEGQTKEVLGTAAVRAIVAKLVEDGISANFTGAPRVRAEASRVLDKVVGEMRARMAARAQKEVSRRKNALESSSLPTKLVDCRSNEVARSELFIVEGDSALGTARMARSADFQALLPIRGKILNVQKATVGDMLKNSECAALIQVLGGGSGRTFDLDSVRYGKIILMTDADVDGAHIRTLLLTLFFRYMRPLVEAGRVYAAVPPLHRIETVASGRAKGEVTYTYSQAEMERHVLSLRRAGKQVKEPIQRYKGLGEMDAHQLAETTMNQANRTLRRITVADEASLQRAEGVFELLMGSDVAPRKDVIVAAAGNLDREAIDA